MIKCESNATIAIPDEPEQQVQMIQMAETFKRARKDILRQSHELSAHQKRTTLLKEKGLDVNSYG